MPQYIHLDYFNDCKFFSFLTRFSFTFLSSLLINCVKLTSSQKRTFSSVRFTCLVLAFILRVLRQTLIYFRIYSKFCICNIIWDLQHILVDQSHRNQKLAANRGDFLAKNAKMSPDCVRWSTTPLLVIIIMKILWLLIVGPAHHYTRSFSVSYRATARLLGPFYI